MDVKYDLIALHMHHGCVKKKKKIEEMVVRNGNENDPEEGKKMKRKMRNEMTLKRVN